MVAFKPDWQKFDTALCREQVVAMFPAAAGCTLMLVIVVECLCNVEGNSNNNSNSYDNNNATWSNNSNNNDHNSTSLNLPGDQAAVAEGLRCLHPGAAPTNFTVTRSCEQCESFCIVATFAGGSRVHHEASELEECLKNNSNNDKNSGSSDNNNNSSLNSRDRSGFSSAAGEAAAAGDSSDAQWVPAVAATLVLSLGIVLLFLVRHCCTTYYYTVNE